MRFEGLRKGRGPTDSSLDLTPLSSALITEFHDPSLPNSQLYHCSYSSCSMINLLFLHLFFYPMNRKFREHFNLRGGTD